MKKASATEVKTQALEIVVFVGGVRYHSSQVVLPTRGSCKGGTNRDKGTTHTHRREGAGERFFWNHYSSFNANEWQMGWGCLPYWKLKYSQADNK